MKGLMNTLSVSAIGLLSVAVLYQPLPKAYKTALLFGGVASAGLICLKLEDFAYELKEEAKEQAFYDEMEGINDKVLSMQIAAHEAQQEVLQEYVTMGQLRAKFYNTLPYHEAKAACERFGIFDPQPETAVNTTATPVQAAQVVQSVPRQETESSVVHQPIGGEYGALKNRVQQMSTPVPSVPQILKTEDVALTFAQSTLSTDTINNLLIVSEQGTGKSSMLCAFLHKISQVTNGNADFFVMVGKKPKVTDPGYCGLEKNVGTDYFEAWKQENIDQVISTYRMLTQKAQEDYLGYPIITIQEEINNIFGTMDMFEIENPQEVKRKGYLKEVCNVYNATRLTAGRSAGVVDIITSHSADVQHIGYKKEYQNNFQRIFLGRLNKTTTISKAFTRGVIPDDEKRLELQQKFNEYIEKQHPHNTNAIALTNAGTGEWRLVILPDYREFTRPLENPGILNSTGDDLIDAIYEDEEPVETPEEKPVPDERLTTPEGQKSIFVELFASVPKEYLEESRTEGVKLIKEFTRDFFWSKCQMKYPEEQLQKISMYIYDTLKDSGN